MLLKDVFRGNIHILSSPEFHESTGTPSQSFCCCWWCVLAIYQVSVEGTLCLVRAAVYFMNTVRSSAMIKLRAKRLIALIVSSDLHICSVRA